MSEPIKVLVINYKMQCAGIESFIMNIYRNIDRTKVQFDFLVHYTERQFYDDEIEMLGGKIYRLSIREDNNFIKYFKDLKKFFQKHHEYRIVHGHMESFGLFYLRAAYLAGVPTRIAHSHIAQRNVGLKGFIKSLLNTGYKKYATDCFACSDIAGKFVFGNKSKYSVYKNAIDVKKFIYNAALRNEIRQELGIDSTKFVVGHVGRFDTQKNHSFLIEIFKSIYDINKNAILLLIGEGTLRDAIYEKASSLGIGDRVYFLGLRLDMNKIYQAMDAFVMPSLFEGLPVSGIEAQASGLKCFFSDTISADTKVTENAYFLSLDDSATAWSQEILSKSANYERLNMSQYIINAGYDISYESKRLENFYIEEWRKHIES